MRLSGIQHISQREKEDEVRELDHPGEVLRSFPRGRIQSGSNSRGKIRFLCTLC